MKKYIVALQLSLMLVLNVFIFSPLSTQAQGICGTGNSLTQDSRTKLCVVPGETRGAADIITRVINYLLLFAALIAILFIVLGGYRYITAQGNAENAKAGRTTVVNAIIGLAIIILAYVIVSVVNNTLAGENTFWGRVLGP
ncbi:MAG: hypothetical protein JWO40_205 [Candidatus Doudnabacteria bacterium]|nr:hypothetical protein [Candidatus Doudnabacteria bacterium]